MKAIITKYLGPTDRRGSRIKATDGDSSITVPLDSADSSEISHAKAAEALCRKLGWTGRYIGGGLSGRGGIMAGMVWVDAASSDGFRVK